MEKTLSHLFFVFLFLPKCQNENSSTIDIPNLFHPIVFFFHLLLIILFSTIRTSMRCEMKMYYSWLISISNDFFLFISISIFIK